MPHADQSFLRDSNRSESQTLRFYEEPCGLETRLYWLTNVLELSPEKQFAYGLRAFRHQSYCEALYCLRSALRRGFDPGQGILCQLLKVLETLGDELVDAREELVEAA